jgi:signal transduction histidine kinase
MNTSHLQFEVPHILRKFHQEWLKHENAHGLWNLPIPASVFSGQQAIVCEQAVSVDYLTLMEFTEIRETFERLLGKDQVLSSYLHSKNEILRDTLNELQATQEKLLHQEHKAVVGELTAGLVHEIRNLLNPIGFLELIRDDISPKNQEYVNYIYESRTRILELIDDVRLLSKDEEVSYNTSHYKLDSVIKEAVNLSRLDSDVKNQTLSLELDYPGDVQINKNKIIQVLLNLIRNAAHALQAIPAGKIIIKTQAEHELVLVSIIDNGIGIETELLDKIWQPFFTTKGDRGTGLGLGICRNIIENHRGTISCESQKNTGTRFCFSIHKSNATVQS